MSKDSKDVGAPRKALEANKGIDIKPADYTTADIFIPMCMNYLLSDEVTSDHLISIAEVASFFEYFCDELNIDQCEGIQIEYYRLSVDMQLVFIYTICEKESYQSILDAEYQFCIETLRDQVRHKYSYGIESAPTNSGLVSAKVEEYCAIAYRTTIYYHWTIQPSVAPSLSPSVTSTMPTTSSQRNIIPTPAPSRRLLSTSQPTSYASSFETLSPSSNSNKDPSNGSNQPSTTPSYEVDTNVPSGKPSYLSPFPSSNSKKDPSNGSNQPSTTPSHEVDTNVPSGKSSYLSPSPSSNSNKDPSNGSNQPSTTPSASSLIPSIENSLKPSLRPSHVKPTPGISAKPSVYPSSLPTPSVNSSNRPTILSSGKSSSVSPAPSRTHSFQPSLRSSVKLTPGPTIVHSEMPSDVLSMNPSYRSIDESIAPTTSPIDSNSKNKASAAPSNRSETLKDYSPSMVPSTKVPTASSNSPSNFRSQPSFSNQPSSKTLLPSSTATTTDSEDQVVLLRDQVLSFTYMVGYDDVEESQSFYKGNTPSTFNSLTYAIITTLLQPIAVSAVHLRYGISEVDHKTVIRSTCTADFVKSTDCVLVVSEIRFPHEENSTEDVNNNLFITIRDSMDDSTFRDRVAKEEVKEVKYVQDGDGSPATETSSRGISGGPYIGIGLAATLVICAPFVAIFVRSSRNNEEEEESELDEDLISVDPLENESE